MPSPKANRREAVSKSDDVSPVITAFKAFDKDLKCRGFQYEVDKTYKHEGQVVPCESGFHFCENPLDVLDYYPLDTATRFAVVKASGQIKTEGNKSASAEISISAELKFPQFVVAAVDFIKSACNFESKPAGTASGDSSKLAASGYSSKLAASGDYSKLAASGDYSKLAASGYSSQLAASGDYSKLAASGDSSKLAASGDYSKLAASGYSSQLAASGYSSQLAASGENSIAAAISCGCTAKAGIGGCIALRWNDGGRPRLAVAYVGENGIKADTWYRVDEAGQFVEVSA
jgi:hypothetical protein